MLLDIFPDFDFGPDVREEELNDSYNKLALFFISNIAISNARLIMAKN